MTLSLKEKYIKAASFLKDQSGSEEVTTLIHRTSWVRILLEYNKQEGDFFFIEIEMCIPDSNGASVADSSLIIDRLSEHLQYFQRLREVGFELLVIESGCIYCASKKLHETPEDNIFRILIPPRID